MERQSRQERIIRNQRKKRVRKYKDKMEGGNRVKKLRWKVQ